MKFIEWKRYDSISGSAFEKLYGDRLLTDVTLACEGNKKLEAHQVILSSCSSFFKEIFQENQHPHPFLYLQGIDIENLALLKKFMYLGRATVEQDLIPTFFDMSKRFLDNEPKKSNENMKEETEEKQELVDSVSYFNTTVSEGQDNSVNPASLIPHGDILSSKCVTKLEQAIEANTLRIFKNPNIIQPIDTNAKTSSQALKKDKLPIKFIVKLKQSCLKCNFKSFNADKVTSHIDKMHSEQLCMKCGISLENMEKLRIHLRNEHTTHLCEDCSFTTGSAHLFFKHKKSHNKNSWPRCDQCEFTSYSNYRVNQHRETHNPNNEYKCESCDLTAKTYKELKYHNNKVHNGIRYACEICPYSATKRVNLKTHKISVHAKAKTFCRYCTFSNSLTSRVKLHEARKHKQEMEEGDSLVEPINT